jgi:glycosyltransferase involved in cell wall biosynthesis
MAAPLVSVIIPCFNQGLFLDEAVDSVLSQTLTDFEILIVDDGSTEPATCCLLDTYQRPNTRVFRTANQGLAAARNYLIERATGTYLCALDADDRLHPEFLSRTVAVLEADPSVAFGSSHLRMFGDEDRLWPTDARCDLPTLLAEDTVLTAAVVRKAIVESVGGYDSAMPHAGDEDWDLWLSLVEAGHRGVILPDVLFFYRRRRGSMCDQCTEGQSHLDLIQYIVAKHRASYRAHLLPVLMKKEERIAALRAANLELEIRLDGERATLDGRRAERDLLRARLATAQGAAGRRPASPEWAALVEEHRRAREEVTALRQSVSWRLTAPLRRAYDVLHAWRRRSP